MADEPSQAPVEDSLEQDVSQDETRVEDKTDSDVDWEQRYKDTQADYTRVAQERAEYEAVVSAAQDPDHPQHTEALNYLGLEAAEAEEDEDEYLDPYDELRAELDQLKEGMSAQEQAAQEEAVEDAEDAYVSQQLEEIGKEAKREFSQEEIQLLGDLALSRRDEDGIPDVKGAYELVYKTVLEKQRGQWLDSKRAAATAPVGVPGSEKVNLNDAQTRQRLMAEAMEAESD